MTYSELYQKSMAEPLAFWQEQAQAIDWYRFPKKILSQDRHGLWRWYADGLLNTCYLALDRHVQAGRGEQTALIYDSPVTQTLERYSYRQLQDETARFAGVLQQMGVKKGDRVIIYMSLVPQVVVGMLACARLGAVHSVVFGGFAAHELALRIDDAKPKVILTASAGIEFDKIIPYQPVLENALREARHKVKTCIVLQRPVHKWQLKAGRDHDWLQVQASAQPVDPVPVKATDPLYILYTSGTTGKPKGIVRDNGGHAVALRFSMRYIYDTQPGEVYWAASDVGWVVGHSYIVYGPLITGCTTVLYEGKPVRTPDAGAFWRVISEHQVKTFFTAPTAFRAIKKEDPEGLFKEKYDISCLKYQFLAGERCDVATLEWAQQLLGVPVIDHWWQTESGYPMLANPAGVELLPIKPGSAGKPVPGFDIQMLDENFESQPAGVEGAVCIRLPLPPGCLPSLWKAPDRFKESYLSAFPGYYFTGDGGYVDADGYVFITGRIDDVINVAGHRLSTADMEEIVATHPAVAECAVVGVLDSLKGQVPVGFVVLKSGVQVSEKQVQEELAAMVRERLGAIACFKQAVVTKRLPKTRSGKILRKIMRHLAEQKPFSPPGTIEDMAVLEEMENLMADHHIGAWQQEAKAKPGS
ncbi:MAG: propionyl-CoA synthetase [Saprospiraceae bacterium]|nr:propionyl-CoA synthetase [Saprospiraceae bacterium]